MTRYSRSFWQLSFESLVALMVFSNTSRLNAFRTSLAIVFLAFVVVGKLSVNLCFTKNYTNMQLSSIYWAFSFDSWLSFRRISTKNNSFKIIKSSKWEITKRNIWIHNRILVCLVLSRHLAVVGKNVEMHRMLMLAMGHKRIRHGGQERALLKIRTVFSCRMYLQFSECISLLDSNQWYYGIFWQERSALHSNR